MTKRGKNIKLWIITWASLLLLVLYSPIGSPDLYKSGEYYVNYIGVNFDGNNLKNLPKNNDNYNNPGNTMLPVSTSGNLNGINYSHTNNFKNQSSEDNHDLAQRSPYQTDYNNSNQTNYNYMGGDNYMSLNSSAKSVYTSPKISNVTISSDLLINQDNTSPFSAKMDATGGTDPGGDPLNPPVPVGDGWVFLIVLGITYIVIKQRIFLKK